MSDEWNAPSGRTFTKEDFKLIGELYQVGTIAWGACSTLNCGIQSRLYLGGRNDLTEHPLVMIAVGKKLLGIIKELYWGDCRHICLIGVPEAGNILAIATIMAHLLGHGGGKDAIFRPMHKAKKEHSPDTTWTGAKPDLEHHRYMVLENTLTSGRSIVQAAEHLIEDGYPAADLDYITLFDRGQGGFENLIRSGVVCRVHSAFLATDIIEALHNPLGLWSRSQVQAAREDLSTPATLTA